MFRTHLDSLLLSDNLAPIYEDKYLALNYK